MKWFLTMLVIVSPSYPGFAQSSSDAGDGNIFFEMCEPQKLSSTCLAYVKGLNDGIAANRSFMKSEDRQRDPFNYCVPAGISTQQAFDVLINWMRNHPEGRHYPTGFQFLTAMNRAFPCANQ